MYGFHHRLLFIAYFGHLIHCQNQRTNVDNHGLYSSMSISCSSGSCRQNTTIIAGSILGSIVGLILLIVGTFVCCNRCKGRPLQTNFQFVNSINQKSRQYELDDNSAFKSGSWTSRHFQSGIWHGFHCLTLSFDPQLFKVTGSGSDNIGMFTIDGTYSLKNRRIGFTQTYQLGTSRQLDDCRYRMIIQLTWNAETRQFEGKWYVQTRRYREEDKFELKFSEQHPCLSL